jgi:hypothetical protein
MEATIHRLPCPNRYKTTDIKSIQSLQQVDLADSVISAKF